jgi:hypothetical protein
MSFNDVSSHFAALVGSEDSSVGIVMGYRLDDKNKLRGL